MNAYKKTLVAGIFAALWIAGYLWLRGPIFSFWPRPLGSYTASLLIGEAFIWLVFYISRRHTAFLGRYPGLVVIGYGGAFIAFNTAACYLFTLARSPVWVLFILNFFLAFIKDNLIHRQLFPGQNHSFLRFHQVILVNCKWQLLIFLGKVSQKYDFLKRHPILTHTTYFFRDHHEYEEMFGKIPPQAEPLDICILGCSTGQEAYSIALFLTDQKLPFSITAADLSAAAIACAKKGCYDAAREKMTAQSADQNNPALERMKYYFDKYSLLENGMVQIPAAIREKIIFRQQDITDIPDQDRFDYIFCRKTLYYLPAEKLSAALEKIRLAVKKGQENHIVFDEYTRSYLKNLNIYI